VPVLAKIITLLGHNLSSLEMLRIAMKALAELGLT
jgi:hypothetical protein